MVNTIKKFKKIKNIVFYQSLLESLCVRRGFHRHERNEEKSTKSNKLTMEYTEEMIVHAIG